jgi:hypothetical protein
LIVTVESLADDAADDAKENGQPTVRRAGHFLKDGSYEAPPSGGRLSIA